VRPRWLAAAEVTSLCVFAALFALVAAESGAAALEEPLAFGAGAAAGALSADLAGGVVHWLCDRFGSESTPFFGPHLIASFREHHRDPSAITRHALPERSGANAFAVLPVLAAAHAGVGALPSGAAAFVLGAALAFSGFVALTNEIHLQAHLPRRSRAVAWLQRLRLVLPPEAHARHHGGAHDRSFCIATGWSNAWLDRLEVWGRLERRLGRGA
jgi:ubiquitin-conjugating enzyme E2 variant